MHTPNSHHVRQCIENRSAFIDRKDLVLPVDNAKRCTALNNALGLGSTNIKRVLFPKSRLINHILNAWKLPISLVMTNNWNRYVLRLVALYFSILVTPEK